MTKASNIRQNKSSNNLVNITALKKTCFCAKDQVFESHHEMDNSYF